MMRKWRSTAARRMARNCNMNKSVLRRLMRMPRTPKNGFGSGGSLIYGTSLSPPTSSVRTVTGQTPMVSPICNKAFRCSSSLGGVSRVRNRNSVRNRPMPSAPFLTALRTSCTLPTLAKTSTRCPSRVTAGAWLASINSLRDLIHSSRRDWISD